MEKELDKVYNIYIKKYQATFNNNDNLMAMQENAKAFDIIYKTFTKELIKKANILLDNDTSLKQHEVEKYLKELILNFGRSILNPF